MGRESAYVAKSVGRALITCLKEVCEKRPLDPIEYMAHWLYRHAGSEIYFHSQLQNLQQAALLSREMKRNKSFMQRNIYELEQSMRKAEEDLVKFRHNITDMPKVFAGRPPRYFSDLSRSSSESSGHSEDVGSVDFLLRCFSAHNELYSYLENFEASASTIEPEFAEWRLHGRRPVVYHPSLGILGLKPPNFDHWRVDQDPGALVNMYDHEICITGGTYGASGVFDTGRASGVFDTENDNVYFQQSRQSSRDVTGPDALMKKRKKLSVHKDKDQEQLRSGVTKHTKHEMLIQDDEVKESRSREAKTDKSIYIRRKDKTHSKDKERLDEIFQDGNKIYAQKKVYRDMGKTYAQDKRSSDVDKAYVQDKTSRDVDKAYARDIRSRDADKAYAQDKRSKDVDKAYGQDKRSRDVGKAYTQDKRSRDVDKSYVRDKEPRDVDKAFSHDKVSRDADKAYMSGKRYKDAHKAYASVITHRDVDRFDTQERKSSKVDKTYARGTARAGVKKLHTDKKKIGNQGKINQYARLRTYHDKESDKHRNLPEGKAFTDYFGRVYYQCKMSTKPSAPKDLILPPGSKSRDHKLYGIKRRPTHKMHSETSWPKRINKELPRTFIFPNNERRYLFDDFDRQSYDSRALFRSVERDPFSESIWQPQSDFALPEPKMLNGRGYMYSPPASLCFGYGISPPETELQSPVCTIGETASSSLSEALPHVCFSPLQYSQPHSSARFECFIHSPPERGSYFHQERQGEELMSCARFISDNRAFSPNHVSCQDEGEYFSSNNFRNVRKEKHSHGRNYNAILRSSLSDTTISTNRYVYDYLSFQEPLTQVLGTVKKTERNMSVTTATSVASLSDLETLRSERSLKSAGSSAASEETCIRYVNTKSVEPTSKLYWSDALSESLFSITDSEVTNVSEECLAAPSVSQSQLALTEGCTSLLENNASLSKSGTAAGDVQERKIKRHTDYYRSDIFHTFLGVETEATPQLIEINERPVSSSSVSSNSTNSTHDANKNNYSSHRYLRSRVVSDNVMGWDRNVIECERTDLTTGLDPCDKTSNDYKCIPKSYQIYSKKDNNVRNIFSEDESQGRCECVSNVPQQMKHNKFSVTHSRMCMVSHGTCKCGACKFKFTTENNTKLIKSTGALSLPAEDKEENYDAGTEPEVNRLDMKSVSRSASFAANVLSALCIKPHSTRAREDSPACLKQLKTVGSIPKHANYDSPRRAWFSQLRMQASRDTCLSVTPKTQTQIKIHTGMEQTKRTMPSSSALEISKSSNMAILSQCSSDFIYKSTGEDTHLQEYTPRLNYRTVEYAPVTVTYKDDIPVSYEAQSNYQFEKSCSWTQEVIENVHDSYRSVEYEDSDDENLFDSSMNRI